MKNLLCLLILAATVAVKAQDTTAILSYAPTVGGYVTGTGGWSFQPLTNVTVTALGCFDYIITNQPGPVWVGLWAADGSLLASNSVSTNSVLVNDAWYAPISPVPLLTNETYSVAAFSPAGPMIISAFTPGDGGGYVDTSPEIQLGMAVATTNASFVFPETIIGPAGSAILAPNFEFHDGIAAPVLSIVLTNNYVQVSWPAVYAGLVLQENSNLATTNWMTTTNPVFQTGGKKQVLIPLPAGNNFYRLKSP